MKLKEITVNGNAKMGRPPIYDEPMKQTSIFLPIPMHNWLKTRTVPMSVFVRDLLAKEMEKDKRIPG